MNLERELEDLLAEYHEPLSDKEMLRVAQIWRDLADEAGCLEDYRAVGGFDWWEVTGSLPTPWSRYPEAWARLLLEDDVRAIAAARAMWGLPLIR